MNDIDYSVSIYGLVLLSMPRQVNSVDYRVWCYRSCHKRRLQFFHIWVGVIIHATISEWWRLQFFHIWFGVIVHGYATHDFFLCTLIKVCMHVIIIMSCVVFIYTCITEISLAL